MILNSRDNLFEFNFPKTFMPKSVADKYRKYLDRIPGNVISEPLDFINYTIQSINLPGMGFEPVIQNRNPGRNWAFRSTLPTQELFQKEFTVTFQLVDGYINYWMLLELLGYYYQFDTKKMYIDDLNVRITDAEGNVLVTARIMQPLIKNISELSMSFASNVAEFKTFDLTIGYNEFQIDIEND